MIIFSLLLASYESYSTLSRVCPVVPNNVGDVFDSVELVILLNLSARLGDITNACLLVSFLKHNNKWPKLLWFDSRAATERSNSAGNPGPTARILNDPHIGHLDEHHCLVKEGQGICSLCSRRCSHGL